jgi:hypothetical protein
MSTTVKHLTKRVFNRIVPSVVNELELERGTTFAENEAVAQKNLMLSYRLLAAKGQEFVPSFADAGFRKYSQFEEDGILLLLFSLIRPGNRTCVEICAGNGRECMCSNLIINHGWWGHLFDGDPANVSAGRRFFANNESTFLCPPKFTQTWITAENVNREIEASGAKGPIDLLSLDIDGMDYWVWKALTIVQPQVVVCETHNLIPPEYALTVPYNPDFSFESEEYRGASLAAMCKLGREKGYRLVGTHRYGFNAFFVKQGVGEEYFPEVTPESCQADPLSTSLRHEAWPRIKHLNWLEV